MAKIHLGETPNNLCENDFDTLGWLTEGASGSDIAVLVKEALMEPLRRCQQAQQFMPVGDHLVSCEEYPHCTYCQRKLSTDTANKSYDCTRCGAKSMTRMEDVPTSRWTS